MTLADTESKVTDCSTNELDEESTAIECESLSEQPELQFKGTNIIVNNEIFPSTGEKISTCDNELEVTCEAQTTAGSEESNIVCTGHIESNDAVSKVQSDTVEHILPSSPVLLPCNDTSDVVVEGGMKLQINDAVASDIGNVAAETEIVLPCDKISADESIVNEQQINSDGLARTSEHSTASAVATPSVRMQNSVATQQSAVTNVKEIVAHKKIYTMSEDANKKEDTDKKEVLPFTEEQLAMFYFNPELMQLQSFVDEFLKVLLQNIFFVFLCALSKD